MADVAALKRRFVIFALVEVLALVAAAAGFIGDLVYGVAAMKPLWIAGLVVGVAAQTWLVLGMRAGKES